MICVHKSPDPRSSSIERKDFYTHIKRFSLAPDLASLCSSLCDMLFGSGRRLYDYAHHVGQPVNYRPTCVAVRSREGERRLIVKV